jgi:hypothetical protein
MNEVKAFLESTFDKGDQYLVRDRVMCEDGYSVSIQGGTAFHYCEPRKHANEYAKVELGFPSAADELIMPYAESEDDPTGSVYGYVPIEIVERLIELHGGIARR